jgi:cytochrome c oxidase subunit 2
MVKVAYNDAPQPWQLGFQDGGSPSFEGIVELHDQVMFYLVIILLGVGWMLGSTIRKFNSNHNQIVHKYHNHGTLIELIWTITPALVLIAIAFPSFKLLYLLDEVIDPVITVKAIGNQWFWTYEYSDYVNDTGETIEFDSYMIPDTDLEPGQLRLLEVDNRVILPVDTHIRFIVTARDVIHSFGVPSLGLKLDALPGRLNQTSVIINREGVFYGMCSELCGILHFGMPIVIECVSLESYLLWLSSQNSPPYSPLQASLKLPKLGKRLYSTSSNPADSATSSTVETSPPLHPWYVTGLSDGESSFIVSIYRRGNSWTVKCSYELWLHTLDLPLLYKLQSFFKVGAVNSRKHRPIASFSVSRIDDLFSVIIPHFTNYPLQTQKHSDFLLWAKVVELVHSGFHLTKSGLLEIVALASAINKGISDKLQAAFPDVTAYKRSQFEPCLSGLSHNWICGFTDAEGCFDIRITARRNGTFHQVECRFRITQHIRDRVLLELLIPSFGCGKVYIRSNNKAGDFTVNNIPDATDIIVPFFDKNPLHSSKLLNYLDFKQVVKLVNSKRHLNPEGLNLIRSIKQSMNNSRKANF